MDDLIQVLVFVAIFIIGPLLQAAKKKNEHKAPPRPQQRPGPVPSRTEPFELRAPAPQVPSRTEEERPATTMVPDDLWQVLTGQAPPSKPQPTPLPTQTAPKPSPAPAPAWGEEDDDEELVEVEARTLEKVEVDPWRPAREEARSLEKEPNREPTYIISLETPPPPARQRHAAFHEKISAPIQAGPKPVRKRQIAGVSLRDAFVIETVLGKPKALE